MRQLDRQLSSQFYQRTLLSKNKAAMLRKGADAQANDMVTPEEQIKDPLVLEFLDLLFYHRRLKCLVVIDLKIGKFTHADAGQMHLYLNYAREHWTHDDENPPVGLIICSQKDEAVARYALDGLPNKVMAAEYRMALPKENLLTAELQRAQRELELRTFCSDSSRPKIVGPSRKKPGPRTD